MRLLATNFSLILMLAKFSLAVNKEKEDGEFMEHIMEIMDKPEVKEFMALEGLVTPKIEPKEEQEEWDNAISSSADSVRRHLLATTPLLQPKQEEHHDDTMDLATVQNTIHNLRLAKHRQQSAETDKTPHQHEGKRRKVAEEAEASSPATKDPMELRTNILIDQFKRSIRPLANLYPRHWNPVPGHLDSGTSPEDPEVQLDLKILASKFLHIHSKENRILWMAQALMMSSSFADFDTKMKTKMEAEITEFFGRNLLSIRPEMTLDQLDGDVPYDELVKRQLIAQGHTVDAKLPFAVEKYAVVLFFYIRLYRRMCGLLEAPYLGKLKNTPMDKRRVLLLYMRAMMKIFVGMFKECFNKDDVEQIQMYQTILALELRDTALETFKLLFMAITKSLKPLMNDVKESSSAKFSESLDRAINKKLACLVLMERPENRDKPVAEPVCIGPNPNSSSLDLEISYNSMLKEVVSNDNVASIEQSIQIAKQKDKNSKTPAETSSQIRMPRIRQNSSADKDKMPESQHEMQQKNDNTKISPHNIDEPTMVKVLRKCQMLSNYYGFLLELMALKVEDFFSNAEQWAKVKNFLADAKAQLDQVVRLWKARDHKESFEVFKSDFLVQTRCNLEL